jgi:hypothetical protein
MHDRVAREAGEPERDPNRHVAGDETQCAAMALNRGAARRQHHGHHHNRPAGREEANASGQSDATFNQRMVVEGAGKPGRVCENDQSPGQRNERPQGRLRGRSEA